MGGARWGGEEGGGGRQQLDVAVGVDHELRGAEPAELDLVVPEHLERTDDVVHHQANLGGDLGPLGQPVLELNAPQGRSGDPDQAPGGVAAPVDDGVQLIAVGPAELRDLLFDDVGREREVFGLDHEERAVT